MALCTRLKVLPAVISCSRSLAGHAHWQNIAKNKGAQDAKKSKLMTTWLPKIRNEAKNGTSVESNRNLKRMIDRATLDGVPALAIKNTIASLDNSDFKECQFGVKGMGGFIALIDCATSSVKKTENNIATYLRRYNFSYASVNFQFTTLKDVMCDLPADVSEEEIEEIALQCGTEEFSVSRFKRIDLSQLQLSLSMYLIFILFLGR